MILTDFIINSAKQTPDKTAAIIKVGYRNVELSYQDIYKMAKSTAVFLKEQDIGVGDKVLLLAPNSPNWLCVYWGCLLNGSVLVPLNTQSTGEMINKIAKQTEAKIIFSNNKFTEDITDELAVYQVEDLQQTIESYKDNEFVPVTATEEDIAIIMYTSGTTGDPKGVLLSHKNVISNVIAVSEAIPVDDTDVFLSILPLSHIYEQVIGFLLPCYKSAKIVYAHVPTAISDLLKEHHVTKMLGVPEFLSIVMSKIEAKAEEDGKKELMQKMMKISNTIKIRLLQRLLFSSVHKSFGGKLRIVASGGAPLDPKLEDKWNALGITLLQGYGLTETSPVVSMNTLMAHRRGSIGKVLSGVEVKIADDGEILVKGPSVFQGYYKNTEKTKEAFTEDGWFKTDDLGKIDSDGYIYINGRKRYMILGPGGQNVFPEDIEQKLNELSEIKDSCVIGLEKESGRVEIHAVLLFEKDNNSTSEELVQRTNEQLASYQQIANWSVWKEEDFPRSATRKVKKGEIIKRIHAER
ncbi:MAG: AMP-binding protein [bacterium]|nr:AMP-binding protein [bacterium]